MLNTLKLFHNEGDVIEVRIMESKMITAGYFKDFNKAVECARRFDGKFNVYFVLNKILEPCYHRCPDNYQQNNKNLTTDADIERRRWLFLDFDPKRPANISSTDAEKEESRQRMRKAANFLKEQGFPMPVVADSGNGWHNLYRINLPNDSASKDLVSKFLQTMDMLFSDEKVQIDTAVFNASRITKFYGTTAVKGYDTKDRPHRKSQVTYIPENIKEVSLELIQKICNLMPKPEQKQSGANYQGDFDIEDWIRRNNLRIRNISSWNSNTKYVLEECPFDSAHGKDSAIIKLSNGAISFHCFHNGCQGNIWQDLRQRFEPGCYDRRNNDRQESRPKTQYPYDRQPEVNLSPTVPPEINEDTRIILAKAQPVKDIKPVDRANLEVFSTGIPTLDENVEILFGKIAIITGINGSGKSTLLAQIMLESLEQGKNVFAYSGELKSDEFQYWSDLQAAGGDNVSRQISRNNKAYYLIKPEAREKIHEWYGEHYYLYKNDESMKYEDVLLTIEANRQYNGCRVIFLDNFMTLDITDLDEKELKAQTKFIWSLAQYVKKHNVLVFLVVHPKKIYAGICQKQDVLGTGNFANAIDYMFIVHRVNEAFKEHLETRKLSKGSKQYLSNASNVIEVGKDRWSGKEGINVAMLYCEDSKRMVDSNYSHLQHKKYGWDKEQHGDAWEPPESKA